GVSPERRGGIRDRRSALDRRRRHRDEPVQAVTAGGASHGRSELMTSSIAEQAVPVPEPELTPDELVDRARDLREWIREEQDATEERGHHSEALEKEFEKAGFYRCLQPRRFGGYEFDVKTFYRVATELSRSDPSTGWGVCLAAGHALMLGSFFEEQAQVDGFGADGEFRAPSVAAPLGTATRVDGGWLVEGTWP